MASVDTSSLASRALPWLLLLYCGASVLHFTHNAEYLAEYPNLPEWISRASIYMAWCAISTIGLCGYVLFRHGHTSLGLALLASYTAFGLDGLLHYGRAPMSSHTFGMNFTIWFEVVMAALSLAAVSWLAASHVLRSKASSA